MNMQNTRFYRDFRHQVSNKNLNMRNLPQHGNKSCCSYRGYYAYSRPSRTHSFQQVYDVLRAKRDNIWLKGIIPPGFIRLLQGIAHNLFSKVLKPVYIWALRFLNLEFLGIPFF